MGNAGSHQFNDAWNGSLRIIGWNKVEVAVSLRPGQIGQGALVYPGFARPAEILRSDAQTGTAPEAMISARTWPGPTDGN
jgi:hypothetical protein